jgi:hypothetical protein
MLPNFTVVICGAVLTVLMLAVAGTGLIDPQTRTRIGTMPEIGRPMMQGMITEPAARGQFAALEMSRRAEELMRLRDLVPATADPAPAAEHEDPAEPTSESDAAAPQRVLPSDKTAVPTASGQPVPAPAAEAAPATDAVPAAVAEAAPAAEEEPPAVAEAPAADSADLPSPEDSKVAAEPAVEPSPAAHPIATSIAPPAFVPEGVAAAPPAEPPAMAEQSESSAEMPASPSLELALADPAAVPAGETGAKRAAPAAEREEAAPVRRPMPRYVPLLPRVIPSLARYAPARLALLAPRVMPTLARHVHPKAKAEAGKPDIAKAAVVPKRAVRHLMRPMLHRAQRAHVAPSSVSPYSTYSMTSAVQYR